MSNIELVKNFYQALNENNLSEVIRLFDKDVERIEPEGFPTSGVYKGITAFEAHLQQARSTWADGSCTPQNYEVSGERILAFVFVRVKLKSTMEWIEGHVTDAFIIQNDKIIFMKSFIVKDQAMEWIRS